MVVRKYIAVGTLKWLILFREQSINIKITAKCSYLGVGNPRNLSLHKSNN